MSGLKEREALLRIEIKNTSPVDLLDLAGSFDALGRQYSDFVSDTGYGEATNARLYVNELKTGSIIAELRDLLDQASWVYDHREVLAAFAANFDDLVRFFLGIAPILSPSKPPPSRQEAERIAQVFEPVAKDGGSQLILQVTGPHNTIIIQNNYTSERAKAVQNGVRRYLGPPLPSQGYFDHELLYLHQVKDEVRSKTGDRGTIERFSPKPVKLTFMSDDAKAKIIDRPDNPFNLAFIVDGQVSTVRGEPALYKIYAVHDAIQRP